MCLAIPGEVIELHAPDPLPQAKVRFGTIYKTVCTAYTPEVVVGDYVIVHVNFAIQVLNREEAEHTLALLKNDEVSE